MLKKNKKINHGFTLIEVLVALVILAIALMAAVKATHTNIRNLNYVRNKIQAEWLADNLLAQMQAKLLVLSGDQKQGETTMLNQHWFWQITAKKTMNGAVQQVTITVTNKSGGTPLIHLTGFIQS